MSTAASQDVEKNLMTIGGWMDKANVEYIVEYYLALKKKEK